MNNNLSECHGVLNLLGGINFNTDLLPLVLLAIFLSILFTQSGIDKVLDFKGNLQFLTVHFKNSLFKKIVPFLLISLTFLELFTACIFIVGLASFFISEDFSIYFFKSGVILSSITICCLFMGQRVAKDYAGAANLTIYFLLTLLGFLFF